MRVVGCSLLACVGLAHPACAREAAPDRVAVAVGVAVAPDYEGSNDYIATLATGALVRVSGYALTWKGNSLAADLVREHRDQSFKILAGPLLNLNFDRALTPRDPVVGLARRRKVALEGGGFVGVMKSGVLTSPYDTLSATVTLAHDLGNVHHSFIVSPGVTYSAPLSRAVMVEAALSADIVGGRYARTYFGVGPVTATRTGLPRHEPGGGLKSISFGLGGAVALNRDLDRRGVLVGAVLNYERLVGSIAASPLVAGRGAADQVTFTIGTGYHF